MELNNSYYASYVSMLHLGIDKEVALKGAAEVGEIVGMTHREIKNAYDELKVIEEACEDDRNCVKNIKRLVSMKEGLSKRDEEIYVKRLLAIMNQIMTANETSRKLNAGSLMYKNIFVDTYSQKFIETRNHDDANSMAVKTVKHQIMGSRHIETRGVPRPIETRGVPRDENDDELQFARAMGLIETRAVSPYRPAPSAPSDMNDMNEGERQLMRNFNLVGGTKRRRFRRKSRKQKSRKQRSRR